MNSVGFSRKIKGQHFAEFPENFNSSRVFAESTLFIRKRFMRKLKLRLESGFIVKLMHL